MSTASALIREARQVAGISQRELASRVGSTQAMVARYESGKVIPTIAAAERLVRACGLMLSIRLDRDGQSIDGVDRSQVRARLRLTPVQRLEAFERDIRAVQPLIGAARRAL